MRIIILPRERCRKIPIRVSEMPGSIRRHVYLFLTTMAHTLDSVLGSKGLRLTVITTFSESFAPWCRLKKEPDLRRGKRGLSDDVNGVSNSSATFCKIFRTVKRNLVPFARRRLYWRRKRVFNPFHDTCVLLFLSFESRLHRLLYEKTLESFEKQQPIKASHSVVESVGCYQNIYCAIFKVILITGKHCSLLTLMYVNFVITLHCCENNLSILLLRHQIFLFKIRFPNKSIDYSLMSIH